MQSRKVAVPKSATRALRSEWPRAASKTQRKQDAALAAEANCGVDMSWALRKATVYHGTPLGDGATEAAFRVPHADFIPGRTRLLAVYSKAAVQAIRAELDTQPLRNSASVDGNSKDML
jgi:hypothetical protein